ncbi:MAG: TrkH family potassium uptake protein [Parvularculaceae bacterium]|nr:TrkH family potassium uptake protein [Parvularculaceae bacterium]
MPDLRPVFLVSGALVAAFGVLMGAPLLLDLFAPDPVDRENWTAFATGAIISIFAGGGVAIASSGPIRHLGAREGFLIVALSWTAIVACAAIPFTLGSFKMSYTDAFFEAMSGITTTGATVMTGLDDAPPGILFWRSLLQWLGGVGVIIMAFAVMPALKIGGMQIFKIEAWDTSEKFIANATSYSIALSAIYVFFTFLCFLLLWAFGMSAFDAFNHALTTVATGGFSTRDASIGAFIATTGAPIDLIVTLFMIIGSLPFGLFLIVIMRGDIGRLFEDSQVKFFLGLVALLTLIMLFYVYARFDVDPLIAFRLAIFNVVSVMTGTGYATADYSAWGGFAIGFFFVIQFIGGCAGSTACGMKIFRFQVALAAMKLYARRLSHPNGVFVAHYNGRPITEDVFTSVLSFFFVYFASFATLAAILSVLGLDTISALSSAATSIANVGPGLGATVGPASNFASIPDGAKWAMSLGMLLGRLEIFTLLVLVSPYFWRK